VRSSHAAHVVVGCAAGTHAAAHQRRRGRRGPHPHVRLTDCVPSCGRAEEATPQPAGAQASELKQRALTDTLLTTHAESERCGRVRDAEVHAGPATHPRMNLGPSMRAVRTKRMCLHRPLHVADSVSKCALVLPHGWCGHRQLWMQTKTPWSRTTTTIVQRRTAAADLVGQEAAGQSADVGIHVPRRPPSLGRRLQLQLHLIPLLRTIQLHADTVAMRGPSVGRGGGGAELHISWAGRAVLFVVAHRRHQRAAPAHRHRLTRASYWRAVHATPEARRPITTARLTHRRCGARSG
jgi:hypothetical protein